MTRRAVALKATLLLMMALGDAACLLAAYSIYDAVPRKGWTPQTATIVSSQVRTIHHKKGTFYCPSVLVSYRHLEVVTTSRLEVGADDCSVTTRKPAAVVNNFQPGTTASVLVSSTSPPVVRTSTYGLSRWFYFFVPLAVVMSGLFIAIALTPARKFLPESPSAHAPSLGRWHVRIMAIGAVFIVMYWWAILG